MVGMSSSGVQMGKDMELWGLVSEIPTALLYMEDWS